MNLERKNNPNEFSIEIIDGYLRQQNSLEFWESKIIADGILVLKAKITSAKKYCTYLHLESVKIPEHIKSVLSLIYGNKRITGYQMINLDGSPEELSSQMLSKI